MDDDVYDQMDALLDEFARAGREALQRAFTVNPPCCVGHAVSFLTAFLNGSMRAYTHGVVSTVLEHTATNN